MMTSSGGAILIGRGIPPCRCDFPRLLRIALLTLHPVASFGDLFKMLLSACWACFSLRGCCVADQEVFNVVGAFLELLASLPKVDCGAWTLGDRVAGWTNYISNKTFFLTKGEGDASLKKDCLNEEALTPSSSKCIDSSLRRQFPVEGIVCWQ